MRINYGINRKVRGRIKHENGVLDLPHLPDDLFDEQAAEADYERYHREIKDAIRAKHPDWLITGYAPGKALSLNLEDSGQNFAGVATIRAALFDVFDSDDFYATDLWEGDFDAWEVTEEEASVNRGSFVDAVIARIAELQSPPHECIKLENLCETHKRQVLPHPTKMVCGMCEAERVAAGCQATCGRCRFVFTGSDAVERLAAHDRICRG